MKILVTGAAGFIGSSLAARLLREGHRVRGVDCFSGNYSRERKQRNLKELLKHPSFSFHEEDLFTCSLPPLFAGVDACFHQAAQPGVRDSWGATFGVYVRNNTQVTQRILEHLKGNPVKFIYASTSSVYGDGPIPMAEEQLLKPVSPYGVSKLAAENLCYLYHKNYHLPFTAFRYFTVYGPKQRPDMAFHIFLEAVLKGKEIRIYGDGRQTRDFTYIDDVVDANMAALAATCRGEVFNLGGGSRVSLREVIAVLEEITNLKAKVRYMDFQKGDAKHTYADIAKARRLLNFSPRCGLKEGLTRQALWMEGLLNRREGPRDAGEPSQQGVFM